MKSYDYDAIVVGARCAGASTAMLLARKGHRVLLIDRAKFPSEIPHGHFIHRSGAIAAIGGDPARLPCSHVVRAIVPYSTTESYATMAAKIAAHEVAEGAVIRLTPVAY